VRVGRRLELSPVATDPAEPWVEEVFEVMEPLVGGDPSRAGRLLHRCRRADARVRLAPCDHLRSWWRRPEPPDGTSPAPWSCSTRRPRGSSRSRAAGAVS